MRVSATKCVLLVLIAANSASSLYTIDVVNRSLTNAPLLAYNETSWAPNTLNPSWLPLPGHPGGGLFFRTISANGTSGYNSVGFVRASSDDGLTFPRVTLDNILRDGEGGSMNEGADPRASYRELTGEYYVTYQIASKMYPGRHTVISRTKTPLNQSSWVRHATPMFKNFKQRDGITPFLRSAQLRACNSSDDWSIPEPDSAGLVRQASSGKCLSFQASPDNLDAVGLAECSRATRWTFLSASSQLAVANTSGGELNGKCLDVNHGDGPDVSLWQCHAKGSKDIENQQWLLERNRIRSRSAAGAMCLSIRVTDVNDCGTVLWFPYDKPVPKQSLHRPRAYAIATFGELRGGNLSLVSSADLVTWRNEGVFLKTRPGYWDNATLSSGPAPVRLRDGNWLLLYDVDNLWPVDNPKPFPYFGRCALGWAILDGKNITNVLARADKPLVYAQLPWEVHGFTPLVVYTMGIKPLGDDTFTVYAGAGDRVVEAFRIRVSASAAA